MQPNRWAMNRITTYPGDVLKEELIEMKRIIKAQAVYFNNKSGSLTYLTKWKYTVLGIFALLSMNMAGQTEKEYVMQRDILESYLSPDSSYLCMIFGEKNEKGKIANMQQVGIFNLAQQQLTFLSENINAKQDNSLMALKDGVLIGRAVRERDLFTINTVALSFSLHHKEDGHVVWTSPDVSGFIRSRDADMGFFLSLGPSPYYITAVRLSNGLDFWQQKVSSDYLANLQGITCINDTSVLVVADKLYKYGRRGGELSNCKYKRPVRKGQVSVFVDKDRYFVADAKNVLCLDENLTTLWSSPHSPLAKNTLAISKDDSTKIRLLNSGYIVSDALINPVQRINRTFSAVYDRNSGQLLSEDFLNSSQWKGNLRSFSTEKEIYIKKGEKQPFQRISTGERQCLVGTDNGDVYLVDVKNESSSMYSDKTVYYRLFDVGDNICVGRRCPEENDFYIIDQKGEVILHLPMNIDNIYCVGDSLYYTLGKSLYKRYLH